MILYPDQRMQAQQPENETVCFAAPIDMCDWNYLHSIGRYHELEQTGMRYVLLDTQDCIYFMRNEQEVTDKVCIVLRGIESVDDSIETAAWIRIKENYPGMIYICRGSTTADKWQTHNAALGAPQEYVCMVDITEHSSS